MVGRLFERLFGRAGFLCLLTHYMQIIGRRDNREEQNPQAGESKSKLQRLRRTTLGKPEAKGQPYQQQPAQVQQ
jgi:hypothetical protein